MRLPNLKLVELPPTKAAGTGLLQDVLVTELDACINFNATGKSTVPIAMQLLDLFHTVFLINLNLEIVPEDGTNPCSIVEAIPKDCTMFNLHFAVLEAKQTPTVTVCVKF